MLNHLKQATNLTETTNGATTHISSESYLLDFFSRGGSMRCASDNEIVQTFGRAFSENPEYALKALFLHRDVREGNGERRLFRICTKWLAETNKEALENLIPLIAEYGRWDDVVALIDTPVKDSVLMFIKSQLEIDLNKINYNPKVT